MSKKSNMWLGLGIGGAIVGLGGTVAALVIAHNKAKKQNKTTSQYLKDKALRMKKNKKKCYKLGDVIPCDCDSISDNEYEEHLEELDDLNDEDLDEMFEDETEDISIDEVAKERDEWKTKYLDLVASLSKADEN